MSDSVRKNYTHLLQQLMQQVGFSSYKQLSQSAAVSEKQLRRLRRGKVSQLRVETLLKLAQALQVPVSELLERFSSEFTPSVSPLNQEGTEEFEKRVVRRELQPGQSLVQPSSPAPSSLSQPGEAASLEVFRQEYQRLQQQLEQQREILMQEFQQSSLQVLESWLVQWPTAAYAAQQNQQLPAVRLLPLVQPVEQLLQQWGVDAIAAVGSELPYDPQWHQLMEGTAQPGELVRVRYTGYRIGGGKLLYRAKVSPISNASKV